MDLLRHLEFFVAIADEEHFGRAARRLGMAQPPLSQGLQRLERRLAARLFERGPRGVALTPQGRELLPRARALLADADELQRLARARVAALRIGLAPQVSPRRAAAVARAGETAGGPAETATAPTAALVSAVSAGRLDLGVVVHPAVLGPLDGSPVVRVATTVLLPGTHPAAAGGAVTLRSLHGLALATAPRRHAPAAHDLLLDELAERGLAVRTLDADDDRAALIAVATGRAFALTADTDLRAPGVARREVAGEPLPVRLRVVWRGRAPAPELLAALTAALAGEETG